MVELALFRELPAAELRRLVAVAERRRFGRNEVVFHQGDPADVLHLIVRGRFAARLTTRLGDTVTVSIHGPRDVFGELALVDREAPRSTTVVALEPAETFAVHRDDFDRLRREQPSVSDLLARLLAERLRRQSSLLLEALFEPAEIRLLRRLLELRALYGSVVPLTQEDLAGLAGTSRATVNRVLRTEAKRGTIELQRGKTALLDPEALARRAGTTSRL